MVSVTLSREYAPTKIERVQFQVWGTRSRSLLSDQNVQETLDGSLTSWRDWLRSNLETKLRTQSRVMDRQ